jgi:hypothetical protein
MSSWSSGQSHESFIVSRRFAFIVQEQFRITKAAFRITNAALQKNRKTDYTYTYITAL